MKLTSPVSAGIDQAVIDHIKSAQDWTQHFPTIRKGNTGVGMTFEHRCAIKENNLAGADLGDAELKAKRVDSDSLLTLMTKNPPRAVRRLVNEFGTDIHADGAPYRRRLYHTLKNGSSDLFELAETEHGLDLIAINSGAPVASWTSATLSKGLGKLTNLCLIDAHTKLIEDVEHFQYSGFTYYHGFDQQAFLKLLIAGDAFIDFRAHFCHVKGKLRDHGTAFRINPDKLASLYAGSMRVEL